MKKIITKIFYTNSKNKNKRREKYPQLKLLEKNIQKLKDAKLSSTTESFIKKQKTKKKVSKRV